MPRDVQDVMEAADASVHGVPVEDPTTLDLSDPDFMATAYATYAGLREQGAVVKVRFPGREGDEASTPNRLRARDSFFVAHFDEVVASLLDERFSVDVERALSPEQREKLGEVPEEFRALQHSLLTIDPPDHSRVRKLVQPSFTGRTMEAMRGSIQQTIDELLDEAERAAAERGETAPNRRMELVADLAYPFPVTVISDLLGIPREDRAQIKGWTENLLRVDRGRGGRLEEEVRAGLRDFVTYLKDLFERKRREPTDDMITRMAHAAEDGDVLTDEEMLATVLLMYLAGHVTTVNLVGNGVVALLTHPDELAEFRANPGMARNVVEETLRYWGPVDFIGRRIATEPLGMGGVAIDKGDEVTVGLGAANRDPAKFANPDAFDISRPDANRHVAFGKGIHVCLGAPLARIEGQIAFETLFRRYPDMRLAMPAEDLRWSRNFLRGFGQIPLLF